MRWFWLFVTSAVIINIGDAEEDDSPIGAAINLLNQYGRLIENVRAMGLYRFVVHNDEVPIVKIFKDPSQVRQAKGDSIQGSGWRLDFCDNIEQLLKSYFQNYQFDGVEKPWNVFTSFSEPIMTAVHFGINKYFINDDWSYVVVSISRYRDSQVLAGSPENFEYDETFVSETKNITVGDASSFIRFTNRVGTHYIDSFVTGESLYQVFVYRREFYQHFKELYKTPSAAPMSTDLLNEYLSPAQAVAIGLISAVSGDPMIEQWANNNMEVRSNVTFKSLFAVARNQTLSKDLNERFDGDAVLELKLRSLAPFIKDSGRRQFFEELFANYLTLYEVNV